MSDLSFWVDNEDSAEFNVNCSVRNSVCIPVPEASVEWRLQEQTLDDF